MTEAIPLAQLRDLCAGDGLRLDLLEAALTMGALRATDRSISRRFASMSPPWPR